MTQPTHPILVPDPRERKLPLWVRYRIGALRDRIRDLEETVAALRDGR